MVKRAHDDRFPLRPNAGSETPHICGVFPPKNGRCANDGGQVLTQLERRHRRRVAAQAVAPYETRRMIEKDEPEQGGVTEFAR